MRKTTMPVALAAAAAIALTATLATTVAAHTVTGPIAVTAAHVTAAEPTKPTIVLVHGAFTDASASWSGVISRLQHAGYPVIAPAVPLDGLASDTTYVTSVVKNISGPVVLVAHSYGGMLIGQIADGDPNVRALVYVAAFIPQANQSAGQISAEFPGSLLGPATTYTAAYPGGTDLYLKQDDYREVFAADRTPAQAALAASMERPIDAAALSAPAVNSPPTDIPIYALVANQDKAIPPAAEAYQAKLAGATIVSVNSAHDLPVSHPDLVATIIEQAVRNS